MKFQELLSESSWTLRKKKSWRGTQLCRKYGSSLQSPFFLSPFRSNIEREENSKIKVPFYKYKLQPAQLATIAISRIIFDLA